MTHPEYQAALAAEDHMRKHMYQPDHATHAMNTDPHYNLIRLDAASWHELKWHEPERSNLLFPLASVKKLSWRYISRALEGLKVYTAPGVVVAGGAVYAALTGTTAGDIDLFIHGQYDYQQALEKIRAALQYRSKNETPHYIRTANAVSVECTADGVYRQVILRHYRSISEIIHGFDVDSCCFAFDGEHVWATQRGLFALTHGYNTVNFDRLSPSYIPRLVKYAMRGMAVLQPDFQRANIDTEALSEELEAAVNTPGSGSWQILNAATGISRLLILEAFYFAKQSDPTYPLQKRVQQNANLNSDYGNVMSKVSGFMSVQQILEDFEPSRVGRADFDRERWVALQEQLEQETQDGLSNHLWQRLTLPNFIKGVNSFIASDRLDDVLAPLSATLYDMLKLWRPTEFSRELEFKVHQPGEQMTNTFHKQVLETPDAWFNTQYYHK